MNQQLIERFLDKKNVFAVVGARRDRQKYDYRVFVDHKNAGYKVYPVNPKAEKISGAHTLALKARDRTYGYRFCARSSVPRLRE